MKISQTGAGKPVARSRNSAKSGSVDDRQAFLGHMSGEPASAAAGSTAAAPLTALAGLLAIQESHDYPSEQRKALLHGDTLLEELEQLQIGLIQGSISEDALLSLTKLLNNPRPAIDDVELNRILDEIDLRAAVELAKLENGKS